MKKTSGARLLVLCPQHERSLDFATCTPEFMCCAVDYVRALKAKGEATRPKTLIIPDDVQALKVSRQRKIQIAWSRLGRCIICGDEKFGATYCLYHQIKERERRRKRQGSKRRYLQAPSYKKEAEQRNENHERD